jgi:hypothetical protein
MSFARSARAAIQADLDRCNALTSCLTTTPLIYRGDQRMAAEGRLSFPAFVVPLRGRHRISVSITEFIRVAPGHTTRGYEAQRVGYAYQVFAAEQREVVAYHWHPERGRVAIPHAHFKTLADPFPMGRVHFPTGPVGLAGIVRLLIEEFAVEPARPDWSEVLTALPA